MVDRIWASGGGLADLVDCEEVDNTICFLFHGAYLSHFCERKKLTIFKENFIASLWLQIIAQ